MSENSNHEPIFHFMAHKAGMNEIDQTKINQIIMDTSRNSEFYKRQQEKKNKYDTKILEMKQNTEHLEKSLDYMNMQQVECENLLLEYEKERFLKRTWAHFDLDMFFVACEIRDDPSLADKPVAVGGLSMISTSNYIARKFGVRAAMPGFIGKKLCPDLILIPGNYEKYEKTSTIFKDILRKYDPDLEGMGLDEANLDLTNYLNENSLNNEEDVQKLCNDIRKEINEKTQITCSCGMAANKLLAKMCSEIKKPNNQFFLKNDKEEIIKFISEIPIRKIPGIGSVTEQLLTGLGINKCSEILEKKTIIKINFTPNAFEFLIKSSLGIGRCFHEKAEDRKSINVSRTFPVISSFQEMENKLKELSQMLADDMEYSKKIAKHVSIQIKTHKFEAKTKGLLLDKYIKNSEDIFKNSLKLLKMVWPIDPVRLLGIKLSDLIDEEKFKENAIDKYFINKKSNFVQENLEELDDDEIIDRIEEFQENSNKEIINTKIKEINLNNKEINLNNNEEKNIEKDKIIKKNEPLPQNFECCICGETINCAGNLTRMNNHIDNCLKSNNFENLKESPNEKKRTMNFDEKKNKSNKRIKNKSLETTKIDKYLKKN